MKENNKIVKFNDEVSDLKCNEQLHCVGVIHHLCKHFTANGWSCDGCKVKQFEAR